MCSLFKTFSRFGLITVLAGTAAFFVAGPERSEAALTQAHSHVMSMIDDNIDDPIALRAQLHDLEEEYPEKIAQVRGDLAELQEQIRQLERERDVSTGVVKLASADLDTLQPLLATAHTSVSENGRARLATVQFENRTYSVDQAFTRANHIEQTRIAYANRAADADHDLVYLTQQEDRLGDLLVQLETERSQFQAQMWQLERQVDAIARNDRLIDLMEKRQKTIEECSRYEVASLDHMQGRLAELRSRQEAELEYLSDERKVLDYEDRAKVLLQDGGFETLETLESGYDVSSLVYSETR